MFPAMKILTLFVLPGLLLGGAGCMHWQTDQFPAPSWNPTGYASPMITKKDAVYAHPGKQNLRIGRAGLMIFRTYPDFAEVGPAFTEIFHRELLAKRTFSEVVLIPETYTTKDEALRLAKRHQVNVILCGELPYYLDGGTVGTSGLQVDLKVMEAGSGRLLFLPCRRRHGLACSTRGTRPGHRSARALPGWRSGPGRQPQGSGRLCAPGRPQRIRHRREHAARTGARGRRALSVV